VVRDDLKGIQLPKDADEMTRLRRDYLLRQVEAIGARVAMLTEYLGRSHRCA